MAKQDDCKPLYLCILYFLSKHYRLVLKSTHLFVDCRLGYILLYRVYIEKALQFLLYPTIEIKCAVSHAQGRADFKREEACFPTAILGKTSLLFGLDIYILQWSLQYVYILYIPVLCLQYPSNLGTTLLSLSLDFN